MSDTGSPIIELRNDDFRLVLDPARGGSIATFEWRGEALMRATCRPGVLDTACFPLVPFSNRIAQGRAEFGGRQVAIAPNFPSPGDQSHPMHGFGWLAPWKVVSANRHKAVLAHEYGGSEWPWPYRAEQVFTLLDNGLEIELAVTPTGDSPMPAGLGFHPYFPRDADTIYLGRHCGEWQTGSDRLPLALTDAEVAQDWWHDRPVGSRIVDTVYEGRDGPLMIAWPSRGVKLTIEPDADLPCTVVYVPEGEDFFCVEPVTHRTDAINAPSLGGMRVLQPGETMGVAMRLIAGKLGAG